MRRYVHKDFIIMNDRWAINIDIEGFSHNYEYSNERKRFAVTALAALMDSIIRIGKNCFPGKSEIDFSDRLYVHQFGDGFTICPDRPETDATRAIAIATAIMRNMILMGYATKAAISSGDLSDITGRYPKDAYESDNGRVGLGNGLMTIIS